MKRLLLALFLIAPAAFAQAPDRAILLTPNGTMYTIESHLNQDGSSPDIVSSRYLTLTIQNGDNVARTNVPASLDGGNNWQPALAFDSDSNTLFVFWLHSQNTILSTSELLFCTFVNGKWNDAASIDDVPYHYRSNLRVGVTRTIQVDDPTTGWRQVPALTVHAAWWDSSAVGESARYAMISVDRGVVTDISRHALNDFINTAYTRSFNLDDDSREMLRHPIVFESPEHDTVDIVFGDMTNNTIHRLTLKPVVQTRVRIPIGVRDTSYPGPFNKISNDTQLGAVSTPPDRLVFYYRKDNSVRYLAFTNGEWSSERSIAITSDVSAEAAIGALRRMVNGD